jgi:hypothetical protein
MATKVARMTPQTESRIVRAVEDVIDRINEGDNPNDAITKIAADLQLPAGHINLLVNAYNTGRTNRQRASSSLLSEKAAAFPLADPAIILDRLYPKIVKSAAEQERAETISLDYSLPPTWLERARDHERFVKQADALPRPIDRQEVVPRYPVDPNVRMKRAYHESLRRNREIEEARRIFSAEQDRLIGCFQKLAAWFSDPRNETIADVRDNVEARWGTRGAAILNHLAGTRPVLTKRANLLGPGALHAVHTDREPYRTLIATIDQTNRVQDARDAFDRIAAENTAKIAEELAPFVPARRKSSLGLPSVSASPGEKQAGAYTTALGVQLTRDMLGHISGQLEGPSKDQLVDKSLREISNPDHEQSLRAIHTQSMLHNLLANDPVISSYHPHEVTEAFNQVSQLAPHAATQPAVMGPLLRKWLQQGNLDTFESDQLVGTEHKLKQVHTPAPRKDSLLHGQPPSSLLA